VVPVARAEGVPVAVADGARQRQQQVSQVLKQTVFPGIA